MKNLLIICFLFTSVFLTAQNSKVENIALVSPRIAIQNVTVGKSGSNIEGFTGSAIQLAIDMAAKTGGNVQLSEGVFDIKSPLRLKSNVTLSGKGNETILRKSTGVQTRFITDADYGELRLTVENSDGFEIGMKIQVTDDDNKSCWNVSTAYITDIQDNVIFIDDYLIRDYRSDKNGLVSNATSVVEIIKSENVTVSNLKIDGNRASNFFADGCNSAGILVLKSRNITIDHVFVNNYNGEGISWQITENVSVKNSEISGSGNTGLHPGTGSPFTVIDNNNIHDNDRDGLFICWRVFQSRVTNNRIYNNGRFGICTGHKDTDVIFLKNHIFNNKSDGINLRGEREENAPHRNTFQENTIENNGSDKGGYGFSINSKANDLRLIDNIFKSMNKIQKAAIFIYESGSDPIMENNKIETHPLGEILKEK